MTARGEMVMEQPSADTLKVILSGDWKLGGELPGADKVQQRLEERPGVRNLVFDTRELASWDSGLLTFLMNLGTLCSSQKILLNRDGLPQGAKRLLELALAVPEKKDARQAEGRVSFLSSIWATKPSICSDPPVKCWNSSAMRSLPFRGCSAARPSTAAPIWA